MQRVIEHGPIKVTVEMPDGIPTEVAESLSVDVDVRAKTEELALAAIEALGGMSVFEPVALRYFTTQVGRLSLAGAGVLDPLEFTLSVPTGHERPVPTAPFIAELKERQASELPSVDS